MKLVADENIYEPLVNYLRECGSDVLSLREGFSGISDNEVYQLACKGKRIIITMDQDFSRLFRFPPEKCGGIIVVKVYKRTVKETLKIFKKYFKSLSEQDINNNLVIITPDGLRIRRAK